MKKRLEKKKNDENKQFSDDENDVDPFGEEMMDLPSKHSQKPEGEEESSHSSSQSSSESQSEDSSAEEEEKKSGGTSKSSSSFADSLEGEESECSAD